MSLKMRRAMRGASSDFGVFAMPHALLCLVAVVTMAMLMPIAAPAAEPPAAKPHVATLARAAIAPEITPQHLYLIRATLQTLSDANRTGNYTVLRDIAAPSFRAANTAADLARVFAEPRQKTIDLAAALLLTPKLAQAAHHDQQQRLVLTGHVPGQAARVTFDLRFEAVGGHWQLAAVAIGMEANQKNAGVAR
jgi:hypothetical protein